MKNILVPLLLGLFLNSTLSMTERDTTDLSEVKIVLKGYQINQHKNYLQLIIPDRIDPQTLQLHIGDSGQAECTLILATAKEIKLKYEYNEIPFVVSTNDKVSLEVGLDELLQGGPFTNPIVSGVYQKLNQQILINIRLGNKLSSLGTGAMIADRSQSAMAYWSLRKKEYQHQLSLINSFLKNHPTVDSVFFNWLIDRVTYTYGMGLATYPFYGRNQKMHADSDYFHFVEEFNFSQKVSFETSIFNDFIESLTSSFVIMANISDRYQNQREELKNKNLSNFKIKFDLISKIENQSLKNQMLVQLFRMEKTIPINYYEKISGLVSNIELTKLMSEAPKDTTPIYSLIKNYQLPTKEKTELLRLYENLEGKVIYHDFWFRGCKPCMSEFPYYNQLIDKSGIEVVFLFLGVHMAPDVWQTTIDEYQLKGIHHLLSKNQIAFYERYFELKSYPHHQIVDQRGLILQNHIPHLRENTINHILEMLHNYVQQ